MRGKRLKRRTIQRIRGSISILLILILVPTMILSALMVDTARLNMGKAMVSSAGDLAMNSALANYDTILKDVYGLFAMSQNESVDDLEKRIEEYFQKTLVSYGIVKDSESEQYVQALLSEFTHMVADTPDAALTDNFLSMEVPASSINVEKVAGSSLAEADILRTQIVEYMKYRAPVEFGMSFLDALNSFSSVQDQMKVIESQVTAQENLQTVTDACSKLIEAIRAYDDYVEELQAKDGIGTMNTIKGKMAHDDSEKVIMYDKDNRSSEGDVSAAEDYSTQLDGYRDTWSPNYKHINRLNLIFCAKPVNIDSAYLKDLEYTIYGGMKFIDGTTLKMDGNGIIVSGLSLAGDTAGAQQQLENQLLLLEGSAYTDIKNAYTGANFLPESYIHIGPPKSFADESAAMEAFITYEKFLIDDESVTVSYSDVKKVLEGLYTLGKYYENYESQIDAEIAAAETAMNTAKTAMDNAKTAMDEAKAAMDEAVNGKAAAEAAYATAEAGYNSTLTQLISANQALGSLPANASAESRASLEADIASLETALSQYDAEKDAAQALYDSWAALVPGRTADYDAKVADHQQKEADYNIRKGEYEQLVADKAAVEADYAAGIAAYGGFTTDYQIDLYRYGEYQSCAAAVMNKEIERINQQFNQIVNRVTTAKGKVEAMLSAMAIAKTKVSEYNTGLDAWETQNNTYAAQQGHDTFNSQNQAEIAANRAQYDIAGMERLESYMNTVLERYNTFLNNVNGNAYFQYGSKKITAITDYMKAKEAVSGKVSAMSTVVTVAEADTQFDTLYPDEQIPALDLKAGLYFLDPLLPLQFLKYLNQNYPETKPATVPIGMEEDGLKETETDAVLADYEVAKSKATANSGKEVEEDSENPPGDFGYTYKSRAQLTKAQLPSGKIDDDDDDGDDDDDAQYTQLSMSEDANGQMQMSSGISTQSTNLGKALTGLEEVATGTLENIYILSYIFENFSYNTLIQDLIMEVPGRADNAGALLSNAKDLLKDADNIEEALDRARTMSNFHICSDNNFIYGAEIEYMLWGNASAEKNVTYTKASIYAIRFAFNCIFAFTDSEIRNTTMGAGLAVQTATLGIVPYKVVQVVLQLALAAAESAIDMSVMGKGLKVAVIKDRNTWSLSISSGIRMAGEIATDMVVKATEYALNKVVAGLQSVVDASAEELSGAVDKLTADVGTAITFKAEEVIGTLSCEIQTIIEGNLYALQFQEYEELGLDVAQQVEIAFADMETGINDKLDEYIGTNEIMTLAVEKVKEQLGPLLEGVKAEVLAVVSNAPTSPETAISGAMAELQLRIMSHVQKATGDALDIMRGSLNTLINDAEDSIKASIAEYGDQITKDVVEEAREKITTATDTVVNKYLKDVGTDSQIGQGVAGGVKKTSSSVTSLIKFGYKDYLMLFCFISICVEDSTMLLRMADMIELNIQNAAGPEFQHKKRASFEMSEAFTYVKLDAEVEMDMLFFHSDLFNSIVDDSVVTVDQQISTMSKIKYSGIYGY